MLPQGRVWRRPLLAIGPDLAGDLPYQSGGQIRMRPPAGTAAAGIATSIHWSIGFSPRQPIRPACSYVPPQPWSPAPSAVYFDNSRRPTIRCSNIRRALLGLIGNPMALKYYYKQDGIVAEFIARVFPHTRGRSLGPRETVGVLR